MSRLLNRLSSASSLALTMQLLSGLLQLAGSIATHALRKQRSQGWVDFGLALYQRHTTLLLFQFLFSRLFGHCSVGDCLRRKYSLV
jgi:hypothetical protein